VNKPLISVVIPTYQHASTLTECLDSVLAQTYKNIEIIVVDDGSTDNTQEVLAKFKDRVSIIKQENQGSNLARNRGWKEAKGEYLIFCDADVIMDSRMLEKLHGALQSNVNASFAYSSFKFGWKSFKGVEFDSEFLKKRNFIHTSALVRAKDFPGFDPEIKRLQDWDVWLTMSQRGLSGVLVDEVLFSVQISGESRIGSSWLPSFLYKIPWPILGWTPRRIRKYEDAQRIICKKHMICEK
jgi:glycosyltransferase involved in cell wall biosynthesis